jgi:hypothetical protein
MLYSSLNPTKSINYVLFTSRINQASQQQGNNLNPTLIQLCWVFKKIFCLNYFQTSPNANCIQDLDQILCSEIASG